MKSCMYQEKKKRLCGLGVASSEDRLHSTLPTYLPSIPKCLPTYLFVPTYPPG
ncbi:hypothetical protein LX36DRAFT_661387 [Colletotrichum falcatum]|nr:hypothetical protein LX36DRAFT_661387 [Colletotrichum falcatum]